MDELTQDFVAETRDMLEAAGSALLAWEAAPADLTRLDEIFRFVHTVKGSCGFLDLPRIAALAHAAETVLAAVRDGTRRPDSALIAAVIGLIDRIGQRVAALDPGDAAAVASTTIGAASSAADDDANLIAAIDRPSLMVTADAVRAPPVRSVRVAVPLLEAMMTQVSELVMVRNELARHARADLQADRRTPGREAPGARRDQGLSQCFDRLSAIVGDLRESVTSTRMQPIDRLFATLPRLVRDTAAMCHKSVTLEIAGSDVEIDREMVEAIRDPLIHIVRNAIDHGIEAPATRLAAGKPAHGRLRVAALQSGNQVSIEISDDGHGIDIDRLVERAIEARVITRSAAAALSPAAAAELIFAPGLSTAHAVTEISGRGVGMDVVRANVERLGGTVAVANAVGRGLTVTLRAPLTLSIVTALGVSAGGHAFAIPRGAVEEVASVSGDKLRLDRVGGAIVATMRGASLPGFDLAELFGLPQTGASHAVVLATAAGQRYALVVGGIGETEELVVRALAPQLAMTGPFAGQSLSDAGLPIVVLDPVALGARAGLGRDSAPVAAAVDAAPEPVLLLLARAQGLRVAVPAAQVERIVEVVDTDWTRVGGQVFLTFDTCHLAAAGAPCATTRFAALLAHEDRRVALPLDAVDDLSPAPAVTTPVGHDGIAALFLHDGQTVRLIDTARWFDPRGAAQRLADAGFVTEPTAAAAPAAPPLPTRAAAA